MDASTYSIVALAMRYFFIAVLLYILLSIVWQSLLEYREIRRVKRQVEGAFIAYLIVLEPASLRGMRFVLGREGYIGSAKRCEICLRLRGLRRRRAMYLRREDGVQMSILKPKACYINGEAAERGAYLLEEDDEIQLGPMIFTYITRPGVYRSGGEEEDE